MTSIHQCEALVSIIEADNKCFSFTFAQMAPIFQNHDKDKT